MSTYNWQQPDWPNFRYDIAATYESLFSIAEKMGLINGKISHLTQELQTETLINLMVEEAIKTSAIEGEHLKRPDIRSSIKNTLGLNQVIVQANDQRAQGIAELVIDVRNTFNQPLSETKLFDWHLMLLVSATNPNLRIGCWRTHSTPMQIVSGYQGKWVVHYEAPPSKNVPNEMEKFISWFNDTAPGQPKAIEFAPIRAAIAHVYFESIHPFEDGNGRIGRAIAEKALSQGFGYPVMLSLSNAIETDQKAYYAALNAASKSNELTTWITYFVDVILSAQLTMEAQINFSYKKFLFFNTFENILNARQLKVVKRMMAAGVKKFVGGMSAKKYVTITGASKATATRDLQHLHAIDAFKQIGSGRNVRYELNL
jgi:Fic family protein